MVDADPSGRQVDHLLARDGEAPVLVGLRGAYFDVKTAKYRLITLAI